MSAAYLVAALAGVCFVSGPSAAMGGANPPPIENKPSFTVGDWWEFTTRHVRQDCARWEVVQADPNGLLVEECDDYKIYRDLANHLELVKVTKGSEEVVTFQSALQNLTFPLEVGKTWQQDYLGFTADDGVDWSASASWEVTAYESVTVAAGTFDAYRIEMLEEWGPETYGITLEATAWWAPAVKMFVKLEHADRDWSDELAAFGLQSGP